MYFWKTYVDDTLTIVEGLIHHVLQQLNSFHPNIQFTFEIESSGRIPFLDILIIRKKSKIETTVYRKSTDTGIYLNWFSFAPNTWKRGTLKNLVHRAYNICSTEYLMKKELLHLEKILISKNNYPRWVIKQILTQVEKQQERNNMNNNNNNDNSNTNNENSFTNENNSQMSEKQLSFITLPYKGQQGEKVLKSLKTTLHRSLPNNIETKVVYTRIKLGSNFQIKDKTKFNHKHDLVYYAKYPECEKDYTGEIGRRLHERICDHSG